MFCSFGIFNSPYDDLLDTFFLSLTSTICCPLTKPANEKELFTNIMSNGVAEKKQVGSEKDVLGKSISKPAPLDVGDVQP